MTRNGRGMRCFWGAALSVLIFSLVTTAGAGTFDAWGYRMKISFAGYNPPGGGTLTNFPALVTLSNLVGGSQFSYAGFSSTNGADLRFAASNESSELKYEIEQWDTNGTSCVWVQVPTITDTNAFIYAYWGKNTNAPAYTTNGATWSEGYHAVWHMAQTNPLDSTSNRFHTVGTSLIATNGAVGRAMYFGGNPARATISNTIAITTNRLTLELLGRTTSSASDMRAFESGLSPRLILRWNYNDVGKTEWHDGAEMAGSGVGANLNSGIWYHVAYVLNQSATTGSVYQSGTYVGGGVFNSAGIAATACIGSRFSGDSQFFVGSIDEFRISKVTRSSNWVWATWFNMMSNTAFQTYSGAGPQAQYLTVSVQSPTSVRSTTATLNGKLENDGGDSTTTVAICWGVTDGGTGLTSSWDHVVIVGTNYATGQSFSNNLTGLYSGSNYTYRCYVTNSTGSDWSDSAQDFQTVYPPVVTNLGPVNGSATTWLRGEVTDTGWEAPDTWFYWWADGAAVTTVVALGAQSGVFSNAVGGLTPGVTYYYRILASNDAGAVWSHTENFQTLAKAWYVAVNGAAPNDGSKWSLAFTNIQDALNAAGQDDLIYLAGHSFAITSQILWTAKTNVTIQGGFAALNDAVLPGPYDSQLWPTVITRASSVNIRLMVISNILNGTLERVALTGGYQAGGVALYGGGLYITGSTGLVLSACVISSNGMLGSGTSVYGGGIYSKSSVVLLSNCLIRGNHPDTGQVYVYSLGGGIYVDGGRMTIRDSIIANNRNSGSNADFRHGGGLFNNGAVCLMTNCLVVGNGTDGRLGDGIYVSAGTQIVQNCTVAFNAGQGLNRIAGLASVSKAIVWGNGDDIVGTVGLAWSSIEDGDSNGVNGCISADPLFERGFYLATNSLCVNAGTNDVGVWNFSNRTTRVDGSLDTGRVDLGYHYPTGFNFGGVSDVYVATNGADGSNGMSWATAFRTMTKAISVARDGTRIYVGSGTYNTNGLETFPLRLDSLMGVQILGTNRLTTLINASGSNQRVLTLFNCANVLVSNVTLTGGAQVAAPPNNYGGGVAVWSCGGVEFSGCAIRHNRVAPPSNQGCYGGGIYSRFSVLSLADCLVNSNIAVTSENAAYPRGAGIHMEFGVLTMRDSVISTNRGSGGQGTRYGGGLFNNGAICLLKNCLLTGNTTAPGPGDGIYQAIATATLTLDNCTVAYNVGQGINRTAGNVTVSNSIFWGNTVDIVGNVGAVYLYYSDFQSGLSNGVNNCVQFDPLFADTNYFHLQSIQGVYTGGYFSGGGWSNSLANSPAIDAGDTNSAYGREPAPNGSRVNMGYDGNSPTASKTDISSVFDPPVVTNLGATQIGHRTVRLNGAVTDTGGSVPECTLALWIAGSGVTSSIPLGLKNGAFSNDVIGLIPGSNYNFAFSAVNGGGGDWSDVKSFSTHPIPFQYYVATNGNDTTGADWATAFRNPQTALSVIEPGDEVYLAGHTFRSDNQLLWTASGSYVRVAGGYAATNVADQPGPYNATNWPTVLTLATGVNNRVLSIANVTASTLDRVTLTGGNRVQDAFGGGIHVVGSTGLVISACVISNNSVVVSSLSVYGGGLYLQSSQVLISNCLVRANTAATPFTYTGAWGGGIYVVGGWMTAINSIVVSNKVIGSNGLGRNGAGMCNENATSRIQNCLMWGNLADNSDGKGSGGGLCAVSGLLTLDNCTVANNSWQGLNRSGGTVAATNSIFWGNGDDLTGTVSVAYCDIQTADAYWTNGINGCITGDPLFVNTNAGDYSLSAVSPCINAGMRHNWMLTAFDLTDKKRILGASVDMGAYETTIALGTIFKLY